MQEVYEKHPELFHYTNRRGLAGILTSQRLWATHYRFLNDSSELKLMRIELEKRLFPVLKEFLLKRFREFGIKGKKKIGDAGGPIAVAREEAKGIADSLYVSAFMDSPFGMAVAVPYITSFCAHTSDQEYEQKNGLLSQWRGYAEDDGYAIVFDTRALSDLYRLEAQRYYYISAHIGDVVYQGDEASFEEEFREGIKKIKTASLNFLESGAWGVEEIFGDVLSMFTRLKHRGFIEEREVRSVAFPMTEEIEDYFKRADPSYVSPGKPMKKIRARGDGAPYIEMFDFDEQMSLPTTRIIVGPQKNQTRLKKRNRGIKRKENRRALF